MKNDVNCLIITDYAAPYAGNFIESIKSLNLYAKQNNNEIVYLFPKRAMRLEWVKNLIEKDKFTIYFFKDDTIVDVAKSIKKIIKDQNIKIMYTHFCRHKTQLAVKMVRTLNKDIKLISHFHNHCKIYGNVVKRNFMKCAYKLYEGDYNIGCSKSVCESMPYKPGKIDYVDNGIFFNRLDHFDNREISELKSDKYVVLMFGFNYYRKGVDIAIKAIKELNNPNIVLAISLASNREKVEKLIIDDFGEVPDFVTFLKPIDNVATYYHRADLFISPSREEGLCYSVIEAAYCKTKILTSNIPGISTDIPGMYLFEKENYVELGKKIKEAYEDKDYKLYDEAKTYVENKYDLNTWTHKIAEKVFSGE